MPDAYMTQMSSLRIHKTLALIAVQNIMMALRHDILKDAKNNAADEYYI
jgi:hypothetical protein